MRQLFEHIQSVEDMSLLTEDALVAYLAEAFGYCGYDVKPVSASEDLGADFIMFKIDRHIAVKAVQRADLAGVDVVKEAHFAKDFYHTEEAWVVSPRGFTEQAKNVAKTTGVRLVEGEVVLQLIESYSDPETTARRLAAEHAEAERLAAAALRATFTMSEGEPGTLVQYHGRERDVVIPADFGITRIGSYAFGYWDASWRRPSDIVDPLCDWRHIRSIVVPEDVVEIGPNAFARCTGLESITLPSTLKRIGSEAFYGCTSLKKVQLPASLEFIGDRAFADCEELSSIELPASLLEIGAKAFKGCKFLDPVRIPEHIETIKAETFAGCRFLYSLHLPEGLKSIEEQAFKGCEFLHEITLPSSLKKIESFAFQGCERLQQITLPSALQKVASYAFQDCKGLQCIALPASLQKLEPYAFQGCEELGEVTMAGEGCHGTIYRSAFADCPKLAESDPLVSLPDTVTVVNDAAFPGMFEGPAHELRALIFGKPYRYGWKKTDDECHIIDSGVAGLNHFAADTSGEKNVHFTIRLDDGCDRGYYAIKEASASSESSEVIEMYLPAEQRSYSYLDPTQREYSRPWDDFYLYLCQCHLVPPDSIDGDAAAQLVDTYRDQVVPLAQEYLRVQNDDTGEYRQYRRYKGLMLSTLDGLHAQIKALNEQFETDAKAFNIDYQHYIALYAQDLGRGLAPSKEEYRRHEEEKRRRREGTDRVTDSVFEGCLRGCGWLIVHALYAAFIIILLFGFLMIMML